jgi:hypothetical protein
MPHLRIWWRALSRLIGAFALLFPVSLALAAPAPNVNFDVGVCDPTNPTTNCLKPNTDGSISSKSGTYSPAAPGQYNVTLSTGSVTTLTVPALATIASICAYGAISYTTSGTTPTATIGQLVTGSAGNCAPIQLSGPMARAAQFIAQSGSPTISVEYAY